MHHLVKRINRYIELINDGDLKGAQKRIKEYDQELLQLGSDFGKLLGKIRTLDANMKNVEAALQRGDSASAINTLTAIRDKTSHEISSSMRAIIRKERKAA